jgi:hypothetical protein
MNLNKNVDNLLNLHFQCVKLNGKAEYTFQAEIKSSYLMIT